MIKRWFVTGTDTEVGKTVASSALLQAAVKAGYCAVGYKPVASGCELTAEGLRNSDALALQKNSAVQLPYQKINPLAFLEPTSPHIVSAEEGTPITFTQLSAGLAEISDNADWVLTEGAGGWFTPLSEQHTFADWVIEQALPVILVVGIRLGCINHALLTAQAINLAGLPLVGWIGNNLQAPDKYQAAYLNTLHQRIAAPCLGEIPYLTDQAAFDHAGDWLCLPD